MENKDELLENTMECIKDIKDEFSGLINVTESCAKRMNKLLDTADKKVRSLTNSYRNLLKRNSNTENVLVSKERSISDLITQVAILEKQHKIGIQQTDMVEVLNKEVAFLKAKIEYLKTYKSEA